MIRRSILLAGLIALTVLFAPNLSSDAANSETKRFEPVVTDDGLLAQPWFLNSFLDLKEDHAEAIANNKRFAIIWEQRGCPYCRELHRVNFQRKSIRDDIEKNFVILQLDMWGSRKVTDFDGKVMEERQLARRWGVNCTPTMMFFPMDPAAIKGKDGRGAEIFRMPGYFKPFHFSGMLAFVEAGKTRDDNFQRFLQDRFKALKKKGLNPNIWE